MCQPTWRISLPDCPTHSFAPTCHLFRRPFPSTFSLLRSLTTSPVLPPSTPTAVNFLKAGTWYLQPSVLHSLQQGHSITPIALNFKVQDDFSPVLRKSQPREAAPPRPPAGPCPFSAAVSATRASLLTPLLGVPFGPLCSPFPFSAGNPFQKKLLAVSFLGEQNQS